MKHNSHDVSKLPPDSSPDARIVRTRADIDRAFVELLRQRSFRSVTVSHITRKASVGRATFYAHYASKDELLRSQFERIILPILVPCPQSPWLLDCTLLFDHVLTAPRLFRNIMSGGEGSGARVIRSALEGRIQALLGSTSAAATQVPPELVRRFLVSTLLTVINHALQSDTPESAPQLQSPFARLAGAGLG